ncbi:MAG: agmatine deiminase family protein [PVC group bacterium]|nr:agmatine deiminase family protein [PVC group bacterium]
MRKILKITGCIFLLAGVLCNAQIGVSQEACSNNLLSPRLSLQQEHFLRIFSADKIPAIRRTTDSKTTYLPADYSLEVKEILVQVNYWGTMEYVIDEIHQKLPQDIAMVIIFNERIKPYLDYAKNKLSSRKVRFIMSEKISVWARDNYIYSFSKNKPIMVFPDGELLRNMIELTTDKRAIYKLAKKLKIKIKQAKFHFTAGDIMTDEENIFVGAATMQDNFNRYKMSWKETSKKMQALFGNPIEVLQLDVNDIDNVLTLLPGKRAVLGNNEQFDSFLKGHYHEKVGDIKKRLLELGYAVIDIPWRPHEIDHGHADTTTLISYNNVVFLDRDRILLPQYGIPADKEAIMTWEQLGYKVIPVQAFCNGEHGGSIRCFTNIINADFINYDSEDSSRIFCPSVSLQPLEQLIEMAI